MPVRLKEYRIISKKAVLIEVRGCSKMTKQLTRGWKPVRERIKVLTEKLEMYVRSQTRGELIKHIEPDYEEDESVWLMRKTLGSNRNCCGR